MSFDIDYRYLKAFHLTARYLSFSRAAGDLNIAQSAVSRQIKLLEESMSEQLIVRSSKKVLLTEKGKSLFKAIGQFEEMTSSLAKSSGPQLVRVGILHGLLENWFIDIIKEFTLSSIHEVKVEADTPSAIKQSLIDGKLDIIFSTENIQNDLITSLRLFEEELVIISKDEINTKALSDYTWISYVENDFLFQVSKKPSSRILTVKSITAMIKLVSEGIGIAIVPSHAVFDKKLIQYPVKGVKSPEIYMSTLNYQSLPYYIDELVHIIKS